MRIAVVALLLLASCTRHVVRVRPAELADHARDLVSRGEATVLGAKGVSVRVSATDQIDVRLGDGNTQRPARLMIGELVAGCVEDADAPDCIARQAINDEIIVRREYRVDRSRIATGIAFGIMGGAIGACIVTCQGSSELRDDLAYGAAGVIGATALFALALMLGGND